MHICPSTGPAARSVKWLSHLATEDHTHRLVSFKVNGFSVKTRV